jgi:hypothetical protein
VKTGQGAAVRDQEHVVEIMKERKELESTMGAKLELSVQKGQSDFSHRRLK